MKAISLNVLAIAMLVSIAGCGRDAFIRAPLPQLDERNPQLARDAFAATILPRFTSDDTVVIDVPFRDKLAVLGVLQVDRLAGTFELLGLSHLGVQIFHVAGARSGVTIRSAVPQLMENRRVLTSVAEDTRSMYLDLVPRGRSKGTATDKTVELRERIAAGTLVYTYGGRPLVLLEKRLKAGLGTTWRVRYYDYAARGDYVYPRTIVLDNARFHYRIVVKNRNLQAEPSATTTRPAQ